MAENRVGIKLNKTGTTWFQDCCKIQTINPGFCYYGHRKVMN